MSYSGGEERNDKKKKGLPGRAHTLPRAGTMSCSRLSKLERTPILRSACRVFFAAASFISTSLASSKEKLGSSFEELPFNNY